MNSDSTVKSMARGRIAVGAGAWLAPNLFGRALLLAPQNNPQAPYLARLFGARDVALGVGTLAARGEARQTWLVAGLACDAADAAAAVLGGRRGYLSTVASALLAAPAVAATAVGAIAVAGARGG